MVLQLFVGFVIALSITAALIPVLERAAPRLGLLDPPGPRKVHASPVPRVGGIAMVVSLLATCLLSLKPTPELVGLLGSVAVLLVFGVWDDRRDLDYRMKFAGQVLAVGICMGFGEVRIGELRVVGGLTLPEQIGLPLTFLFLLGVTNAINLADGLDGLAGGIALVCLAGIAVVAGGETGAPIVATALILAGAILGFLRFNTHPARVFMGDAGSQALGLSLGALAILSTKAAEPDAAAALPLLLVGVPILDTLSVMIRRLRERRSPFVADRRHLHHRLLELGLRHGEAVALYYVLQCLLLVAAYSLRRASDAVVLGTFAVVSIAALGALQVAESAGWRLRPPMTGLAAGGMGPTMVSGWAARVPVGLMLAGALGYAALVLGGAIEVGSDIVVLALLLALAVAATLRLEPDHPWRARLLRVAAYVTVVLLVFLDATSPQPAVAPQWLWGFLLAGGAGVLLLFLMRRSEGFEPTPLDILIIFLAVVAPNLTGGDALPAWLVAALSKAVIGLYIAEMLIASTGRLAVRQFGLLALIVAVLLRVLLSD